MDENTLEYVRRVLDYSQDEIENDPEKKGRFMCYTLGYWGFQSSFSIDRGKKLVIVIEGKLYTMTRTERKDGEELHYWTQSWPAPWRIVEREINGTSLKFVSIS